MLYFFHFIEDINFLKNFSFLFFIIINKDKVAVLVTNSKLFIATLSTIYFIFNTTFL